MDASTIGQYRIVETLGQGGMGIVYRARHLASARAVALKTVRLPAPRWLDSIRREIQALTRVRHPGVVRIVDHGVHEGRPWYAMDLLEGETLRQFGRRIWSPYQPYEGISSPVSQTEDVSGAFEAGTRDDLDPATDAHWLAAQRALLSGVSIAAAGELLAIMRLMRRLCASLAFMHGEGFVNRDLKPENIVLVSGLPVIIDFGLTTHHPGGSGREELEAQQGIAGTVHYMSPEQIRGELVDARSDLYAIGCILYELVCGRPPFSGAPRAVMLQHLNSTPIPASRRVDGVPPALDQLILRLLEKPTGKRPGYADEVAAELAELSHDLPRLAEYPPARSYLYRPGFVGREELVQQLVGLRDRAALGIGAMVLLGGESGSGKTRVAMELTRTRKLSMRLITSETTSLAAEGEPRVASSPLQALRPLLRALAYECHAGGPELTERLLGEHHAVLSVYEPLLAQVPATVPPEPPAALAPEPARRRVFRALTETLSRFARERPLLFVIDDLGWVDEVSLAFLSSLDAAFFANTPILLLCTYRSEDMPETVRSLSELPHVQTVQLPRLGEGPVRSMVSDMLALANPEDEFVEYVTREAEGNPFFVAEYLRAAVSERVLYRDQQRAWQVRAQDRARSDAPLSLALPRSLRELIDQRLRSLSTAAKQVSVAAAVLGRETEFGVLREVSGLPDASCVSAVHELMQRQILEQTELGALRFMHDKLREETYRAGQPALLRELHARAAAALEALLPEGPEAASWWAALGNHFAEAGLREAAVRYLQMAAEYAHASSAHEEAQSLFRRAIEHAALLEPEAEAAWPHALLQLHEAYADLLALVGKGEPARAAYRRAFEHVAATGVVQARLHRKVGKSWEGQQEHERALASYQLAAEQLGPLSRQRGTQEQGEWLEVRFALYWIYYWVGNLEQLSALSAELAPFLDSAAPRLRARYFSAQFRLNLRRERYDVSSVTLEFARAEVAVCQSGGLAAELPDALFDLGFALYLRGELAEAAQTLAEALSITRKSGNAPQQTRCLTYLALCARMSADVDKTRSLVADCELIAKAVGMREYVAAALANRGWVELRCGQLPEAEASANAALAIWAEASQFPFEWLAHAPLLQIRLRDGDLDGAMVSARALQVPGQRALPEPAPTQLRQAVEQYDGGSRASAMSTLEHLLQQLPSGYC
ncbi:MAG: Protein kinase [Myxococcaceae bacterium]|nr:Protein kinase [Myxococcaceae bacterium]